MPAVLPPPPPPPPPGDAARVRELAWLYALAPLAVGGLSRLGPVPLDAVERAMSTGAIYLEVPCLFAVLVLALTQALWAGWIAFALEALLLGMLPLYDAVAQHAATLRGGVAVVSIAYALVRQLAWGVTRASAPLAPRAE